MCTCETPWKTKRQAAVYLGVSENTLMRYVRQGRIVKHYPDGLMSVRFHVEDLDNLMRPQRAGSPA